MLHRTFLSTVSLSHQGCLLSLGTGKPWGPRNAREMAASGQGHRQPSRTNVMYAADVAFVTTLLLPHLPSNVKRLLESTAFKA